MPEIWRDQKKSQPLQQEKKILERDLQFISKIIEKKEEVEVLFELAQEGENVIQELTDAITDFKEIISQAELLTLFTEKEDSKNAILTIHPGAGGTESQDWAQMLLRMYLRYAEQKGFTAETIDIQPGEEAGIKSAIVEVKGDYAYGYLKCEHGVHRLVRLSPFDADHARHTSFALVEVLPEAEAAMDIKINPEDLKIDTFRSSGPGGQHMQKTSSAVRVTHLPTGLVATCQGQRSQHQNKEAALKILYSRLLELERTKKEEERVKLKGERIEAAWGNQIRSYVLHPYKMVKDHRTDYEVHDAEAVLDGELDGFITAYLRSKVGK